MGYPPALLSRRGSRAGWVRQNRGGMGYPPALLSQKPREDGVLAERQGAAR